MAQEIIVDNSAAVFSGEGWPIGNSATNKHLNDYQFAATVTNEATMTATFTPEIATPGKYDIYVWYPEIGTNDLAWSRVGKYDLRIWRPQAGDRSSDAEHFISFDGGTATVLVDQNDGGEWQLIATQKEFATGTNGFVRISNLSSAEGKIVMADAVRFVPSPPGEPPIITSQPAGRTNDAATDATFSVTATGELPLFYQWKKDDVDLSNGGNISGATSATLTLASVFGADSGSYSVVVSNEFGSVTSSSAVLAVVDPIITAQPDSRVNAAGSTATFSVSAIGSSPLGFHWRKDEIGLSDGGNVAGATSSVLTLSNVQAVDAGDYSVVVSSEAGGSITSSVAVLTVTVSTDFKAPTVSIVSPGNNSHVLSGEVVASGTAKDTAPGVIVGVRYRLGAQEGWSNAVISSVSGKTNWVTPGLPLLPGTNVIFVQSVDGGGNVSVVRSNKFYYDSTRMLTVKVAGNGTVKTNSTAAALSDGAQLPLLVGRPYVLTASVGKGTNWVFTNWTGGTNLASMMEVTNGLVCRFTMETNLILQANFITNPFTPVAGKYAGLFHDTNNGVRHESAGFFTVNVTEKAGYSAVLFFDGDRISASGKFNLSGRASRSVSRATKGKGNVELSLALDWSGKVGGTISNADWVATVDGDRAVYSLTNPAASYASTFWIAPMGEASQWPGGFGYAAMTNDVKGSVKISGGAMGDGAKLSQKVTLSPEGDWPMYMPLYRSTNNTINPVTGLPVMNKSDYRGSVWGWLRFTNQQPVGNLSWIKTGGASNYIYVNGFTSVVAVAGSPYVPPVTGVRALNLTNGTVTFSGGNLGGPVAWGVSWSTNNKITASGVGAPTFTLTPKTGLLKGTFAHPQLGGPVSYNGVLLQNQTNAAGHFKGTTQSGAVVLE